MGNANTLWTVDAHCHFSDERIFGDAPRQLTELITTQNIRTFQLGGFSPDEWERQRALKRRFPDAIFTSFGLHPYFVAENSPAALESAWKTLNTEALSADALGEMGLDFRKPYLTQGKERQVDYLQRQLQLAQSLKKPVILHIVRAHEEALKELRHFTPRAGMVHAFTANPLVAKKYLDLGLSLSIGAKLLHGENTDLEETVRLTPLDRLLVESDCPDQPPPGQERHHSRTVWLILERISKLKMLPLEAVVEQTRANLFTMIQKEFRP